MRKLLKNIMMTMALIVLSTAFVWADGPKPESSISNPFVVLMVIIILFLALIIAILARLVTGAAAIKAEKEKQEKSLQAKATTIISVILLFLSVGVFAQDKPAEAAAAVTDGTINGLAPVAYYSIVSVAFLELLVVIVLSLMLKTFLAAEKQSTLLAAAGAGVEIPKEGWWDKLNKFKPIQQEATIDLGHNYDGIRELDNRLPPWWLYGFYVTILFAFVYLYRYHVAHSAPLPREQYALDVAAADRAKAEYLKKAANNVDETSVKLLTDNASLAAGKQIFETSCFPCHGKLGEGLVGPNLTDDYWLHGGSVNDVFKTIKYGYPEKGMKSWKDDFSPVQIAQVTSYIKSLHGTNPPNAKPAQGAIYKEGETNGGTANPADSVKKDTTVMAQH